MPFQARVRGFRAGRDLRSTRAAARCRFRQRRRGRRGWVALSCGLSNGRLGGGPSIGNKPVFQNRGRADFDHFSAGQTHRSESKCEPAIDFVTAAVDTLSFRESRKAGGTVSLPPGAGFIKKPPSVELPAVVV